MPKEQPSETESAPKPSNRNYKKLVFALVLLIAGFWAIYSGISSLIDNERRLLTPNGIIVIEVVDTPQLRAQGLSGRESISEDRGMLFVFDEVSTQNCFWMKDMKFSIDMVWMDEDKKVITVTKDVSPETYPQTFCPEQPAKYGLELATGRAESLEITAGTKLRW